MLQVKSFKERLKMATREPNGVSVKLKFRLTQTGMSNKFSDTVFMEGESSFSIEGT